MADDDAFTPGPKHIYRYDNGKEKVCADPLIIEGCLRTKALTLGTTIDELIKTANKKIGSATGPEQIEIYGAMSKLAGISAEAFELVPFDKKTGEGADMDHALAVLSHFYAWCEKKNPPTVEPSTCSPSAESILETPPITTTSSV